MCTCVCLCVFYQEEPEKCHGVSVPHQPGQELEARSFPQAVSPGGDQHPVLSVKLHTPWMLPAPGRAGPLHAAPSKGLSRKGTEGRSLTLRSQNRGACLTDFQSGRPRRTQKCGNSERMESRPLPPAIPAAGPWGVPPGGP